jgi:CelD/BcsL family acetyltransferase involved in cellulose biosynthesis
MTPPASAETALLSPAARARDPARARVSSHQALPDLADLPPAAWQDLLARAVEPNPYYDPLWALPVAQHARGYRGARALVAADPQRPERLTGFLPVRSAWRALRWPVPMLVAWNGYVSLTVPALDRDDPVVAAAGLLAAARARGAHALFLPGIAAEGEAFAALKRAIEQGGGSYRILRSYRRATLDATQDAETALRAALGAKKLKELRRQRHRLEDEGPVSFAVATAPADVAQALEDFLALEAAGWKGRRGTALMQHPADAAFVRAAASALAAQGRFLVVSLVRGGRTLASGFVMRAGDRACFVKIAMDESASRNSPGVQLALDLTRHLCADPGIALADSAADCERLMIDHLWRGRTVIADVFVALAPRDPLAHAMRLMLQARERSRAAIRKFRERA